MFMVLRTVREKNGVYKDLISSIFYEISFPFFPLFYFLIILLILPATDLYLYYVIFERMEINTSYLFE